MTTTGSTVCKQGVACHIRARSTGHRGRRAVTDGEVEPLDLPGSSPSTAHSRLIDLWSCLSTVADRQLWARAAYPSHHASVPAPGDPRGDDLRCSVACGRSRNTRDWACREGGSGGRSGCGHRRFGSGAKDRNNTALIHLLARIGRSVHGLTFTALLALLLAAHGVSRWDPEPHPFGRLRGANGGANESRSATNRAVRERPPYPL